MSRFWTGYRVATAASIPTALLNLALVEGWIMLTEAGAAVANSILVAVVATILGKPVAEGASARKKLDDIEVFEAAALDELQVAKNAADPGMV